MCFRPADASAGPNKCPHCGHQLRPWTHKAPYCPFCGKRVDGCDE